MTNDTPSGISAGNDISADATRREAGAFTYESASAQFRGGDSGLEEYTRLSGAELRALIVGHDIRSRGRVHPSQSEHFFPDGRVLSLGDLGTIRMRYAITGDVLCAKMRMDWRCRRLYRDRAGLLFQLFAADRNELFPIEIR